MSPVLANPTIYFLRHGETDWNVAGRFQGQRDIPINEHGRKQAHTMGLALGEELDDPQRFSYIASPLARAMETMGIARRAMGLPANDFTTDGRLKEVSYGAWEGFTEDEIDQHSPSMIEERRVNKFTTITPGGESYAMLLARIKSWLPYVEQDSVVVAHGGVIRVLLHLLNDMDVEKAVRETVPQDRIFKWDGTTAEWL